MGALGGVQVSPPLIVENSGVKCIGSENSPDYALEI